LPFQCKINVDAVPPPMPVMPTAQAFLADSAAAPCRALPRTGLGLGTRFHPRPFQCKISVRPPPVCPTAQASLADAAAIPARPPVIGAPAAGPAATAGTADPAATAATAGLATTAGTVGLAATATAPGNAKIAIAKQRAANFSERT
jgi:hypothetical protein